MKREELVELIKNTCGTEIAAAVARVHERRSDLAPVIFGDRDNEMARRDAIVKSGSMLLGWTAQALMKGNRDAALKGEAEAAARLASTSDLVEGITAFIEKRSPEFKGK